MHIYFKNIWIFDTFICQLQWIIICGCTDGNANGKRLVDGQVESAVSMISQDSIFSAQMDYKQPLVSICVIWFFVSVPSRSNQIIFRCVFPFQMLNHSQVASWRLTGHILWSVILTCFVIMLKNVFFQIYFNGQKKAAILNIAVARNTKESKCFNIRRYHAKERKCSENNGKQ